MHLPENKTWFHRLFLSEQQGKLEIICLPHPVINKRFGSKNLTTCPRSHGWLVLELRKFISYDSKRGRNGLTNSFTWANWWVVFVSRGVCAKCILQSQHSQIPKDQRWSQRGNMPHRKQSQPRTLYLRRDSSQPQLPLGQPETSDLTDCPEATSRGDGSSAACVRPRDLTRVK